MTFKFTGKTLFFLAGFICLISVVLAPFGLLFIYMGIKAHITIEGDNFIYKMLTTKVIPFSSITSIRIAPHQQARYKVGYAFISFATVVPLIIEHGGKKTKLSLNYFERPVDIVQILQEKSGHHIEVPDYIKN